MKTLIFNGSPRSNGDTVRLVNEMLLELNGDYKIVNAYDKGIESCKDCRYCWDHTGCCIEDPMQQLYNDFDCYDNIVIASPLYFSELTGELLSLMSRLQMVYAQRYLRQNKDFKYKKKNGVLILAAGGDKVTKPAEDRARIIFNMINTTCIANVYSLETNSKPASEDNIGLEQARNAARILNNSYTV